MSRAAGFGWTRIVSSCFGLGLLRPAPGTIGSAFGLLLFALLLADQPIWVQLLAVLVASLLGVYAATQTSRQIGLEDPSEVVVDELAGVWLALVGTAAVSTWIVAFLLFRLFDIVKPFPARDAEALPEGWGIMTDDLVAGVYTLVLVQGARGLGWLP